MAELLRFEPFGRQTCSLHENYILNAGSRLLSNDARYTFEFCSMLSTYEFYNKENQIMI